MKTLTLDAETYFDREYSLKKMSTAEYILDPRFEFTGLAVKRGREPSFWVPGHEVESFFANEPKDVLAISHNALFDATLFFWRCGWMPKLWCDTLGVARATLQAKLKYLSLEMVAKHLNLGVKGKALGNVIGMRNADIMANGPLYAEFMDYGITDAELCYGIFDRLVTSGVFPFEELLVMDMVLRTTIDPKLVGNTDLLRQHLAIIQQQKANLLAQSEAFGGDKKTLMSNDKFAELLLAHGVIPPRKISKTTGKETYAFAKSDEVFLDLLEHPDPAVQMLVAARMGHKSTIEETRTERFINISQLPWPTYGNVPTRLMPMPLRYSGAHTHRLSGDWKMNVQNMGRGSVLRQSIEAPKGFKIVAGDESQVEARVLATLAGQEDLRLQFENGEDVYSMFAQDLFHHPVDKKNNPVERWVGKTSILGLGFSLGHIKFGASIPVLSQNQIGKRLEMPPEEAERIVNTYRSRYPMIPALWRTLNNTGIATLMAGGSWQLGPLTFEKERIVGPNGLCLFYHNIFRGPDGVMFEYGGKPKYVYGGKLTENVVQFLARIIIMQAAVRIYYRTGYRFALQVHDELVYVVPEHYAAEFEVILTEELRRRPEWMPSIPLDCETGIGDNYSEVK